MSKITPTVGRVVLYTLTQADADAINRRRTNGKSIGERIAAALWPEGAQAHIGNEAHPGQVCAADVVRTWGNTPESAVNLQVKLDGNDVLWVTSACVSDTGESKPGCFHWIPYQLGQAAKAEAAEAAVPAKAE